MEPTEYTAYPRVQRTPSGIQPRPPGVHIEALDEGIQLFQKAWPSYVLASFVAFSLCAALNLAFEVSLVMVKLAIPAQSPLISLYTAAYGLLFGLMALSFFCGIAAMALKQIRGYPPGLGDMFSAVFHTPGSLGAAILSLVVSTLGFLACILPGLWFTGAVAMSPLIALDQRRSAFQSVSLSNRSVGNLGSSLSMFGMLLLAAFVGASGVLACGLGILATLPIGVIAICVEYYYLFPEAFAEGH